jgi:lipopolysaccharide biosynthesis glycosyltransferase
MLIQKSENHINFVKYPSYCPLDELFEKVNTPAGMCYHENYITTTNEKIPEKIFEDYSKKHISTISAGMLLIEPSKDIFYDMIYKLHPNTQTDFVKVPCRFPEEGFLSQYFKGEWNSLSAIYNFAPIWLNSEDLGFKQKEKLLNIKEEDMIVIHYGGYKPWIYIKSPQFFIFDKVIQTPFYIKVNMYWYLQFTELEKLCSLPSEGIIAESVPCLRYYCNWDDIKFY